MNFLNSDFSEAGTSSKLINDFREFYFSQSDSLYRSQDKQPFLGDVDDHSILHGKAGPFATLFWNTIVLSERTAVNYQRNLLAYGIRAGMYGGTFFSSRGCAIFLLTKNTLVSRYGIDARVSFNVPAKLLNVDIRISVQFGYV